MKKKIIHIVPDQKFIDMAFRDFEAVSPGQNILVIYGKKKNLQFIKSKEVRFCSSWQLKRLFRCKGCTSVVFHALDGSGMKILNMVPPEKKVTWIGWGFDYYRPLLSDAYPDGFLMEKTKKLMSEGPVVVTSSVLWRSVRYCEKLLKRVLSGSAHFEVKALSKVDYFSPVLDTEYEMAVRLNPWFQPHYIPWNYGTVEDDFLESGPTLSHLGEDILVGNSASFENNHIEIFELLEQNVDLTNKRLVVPLSYGVEWYREKVISVGREKFGDKFVPLTTYLEKDDYLKIMQGCGYVFMNHIRQQGLGNIAIAMLKGAKIYLNPQSPVCEWLSAKGCTVESIQSLSENREGEKLVLERLCDEERSTNERAVRRHWGHDTQRARTRHFVEVVLGAK